LSKTEFKITLWSFDEETTKKTTKMEAMYFTNDDVDEKSLLQLIV
jgi:hypothetical protein